MEMALFDELIDDLGEQEARDSSIVEGQVEDPDACHKGHREGHEKHLPKRPCSRNPRPRPRGRGCGSGCGRRRHTGWLACASKHNHY